MSRGRGLGLVMVAAVGVASAGCGSSNGSGTGGSGGGSGTTGTGGAGGLSACAGLSPAARSCASYAFPEKVNNELDLLFMIDNASSITEIQGKLYDQLPLFMNVLTSLPNPPSLHVGVV